MVHYQHNHNPIWPERYIMVRRFTQFTLFWHAGSVKIAKFTFILIVENLRFNSICNLFLSDSVMTRSYKGTKMMYSHICPNMAIKFSPFTLFGHAH